MNACVSGLAPIDAREVVAHTRAWVRRAVIGLNLCPFAKAPMAKGQVRFAVCDATDPHMLLDALGAEMHRLALADPEQIETTLVVHPNVLREFDAFNDFLGLADAALEDLGYTGVLQIASFHPQYRFAGTEADDPGNATNRSPYPTLHLLREASVDRAVAAFPDAEAIYEVNIGALMALGPQGWADIQAQCRRDARQESPAP